jgi:hypothetical protein
MLRDEADRMVGAARREVVMFSVHAPLRDIEKAWIYICQEHDARRRWHWNGPSIDPDCLAHVVRSGLDRLLEAGAIGTAHVAVLALFGEVGYAPDIRCPVANELWVDAMKALEAEVGLLSAEYL